VPLAELQRYVDRVVAVGRSVDPAARFTVVSRSRPELVYWQGRGLDLYAHNIFDERALEEAVDPPLAVDAPVVVAEMAPGLVSTWSVEALRGAGYAGVGVWGWGTGDRYDWSASELPRITAPLHLAKECN
jgi:hypothetical protein